MKKEVTKKPKQRKEEMEKSKKPRRIKALKKRSNPGPRKLGSPPIDWNPIIIETIKGGFVTIQSCWKSFATLVGVLGVSGTILLWDQIVRIISM